MSADLNRREFAKSSALAAAAALAQQQAGSAQPPKLRSAVGLRSSAATTAPASAETIPSQYSRVSLTR